MSNILNWPICFCMQSQVAHCLTTVKRKLTKLFCAALLYHKAPTAFCCFYRFPFWWLKHQRFKYSTFFKSLSLYNRQGCSSHRFHSELLRPVWDLSLNMRGEEGGALSPSHSSVFSGIRDWLNTKRLASRQGRNAQVNRSISHLSQSVWPLRVRLLTWLLWGRRGDESVWNTSESAGGNRGASPTNTPRGGLIIY